jgi:hypothetical protein
MHRNGSRSIGWVLGLSLALGGTAPVLADSPATSGTEVRAARELFGLAEADEDAGRWEAALEKLRRVLATKDTAGVRYHVGLCEERLGKLVAAEGDYALADASARAEQARDVLRLVGKKRAEIERRVPHVTVQITPAAPGASLTIDGRAAQPDQPTAVDPGPHDVEVVPGDHGPPSAVSFTIAEGDAKTVEVALSPSPAASSQANETATAAPETPPPVEGARGSPARTAGFLEAGGAALLAAGGVLAYTEAGAAREQAMRSCALVSAGSGSSCDAYRVPVRAWDWAAIGAWAGAGALATWAVVTFARGARSTAGTTTPGAHAVVGAGSIGLEGAF